MSNIPESLRRVLAKMPSKPMSGKSAMVPDKTPAVSIYTRTETTTILRDGTVYRTNAKGQVKYLPSVNPISNATP